MEVPTPTAAGVVGAPPVPQPDNNGPSGEEVDASMDMTASVVVASPAVLSAATAASASPVPSTPGTSAAAADPAPTQTQMEEDSDEIEVHKDSFGPNWFVMSEDEGLRTGW